jgi:hypothetical protein
MKIERKPPFQTNANSQITKPTPELRKLADRTAKFFKSSKRFKPCKRINKGFFIDKKADKFDDSGRGSAKIIKLAQSRLQGLAEKLNTLDSH